MKTTAAIIVALVLAAVTAHAHAAIRFTMFSEDGTPVRNQVSELGKELQAHIQAAQDQLSRYPDWYPLLRAPDGVAISELATDLSEILIALSPQGNEDNQTTLDSVQIHALAVGYNTAHSVGEALGMLSAMSEAVGDIVLKRGVTTDLNVWE